MLAPAYSAKYGIARAEFKQAMTHVAWKNHYNGARNNRAQFQAEVSESRIASPPQVAGDLGVFDCSGVSDGSAAAIIVRAEDAHKYTDNPLYVKALAFSAGPGSGRLTPSTTTPPSRKSSGRRLTRITRPASLSRLRS